MAKPRQAGSPAEQEQLDRERARKARYDASPKGLARRARYRNSLPGVLADIRHAANRRGNR